MLLFIVTAVYTALLITRPHEFIPALAESPLLQVVLLTAFGIWILIPDKGTELPQFRILPFLLMFVWLSLGFAGWWGGIIPAAERLVPAMLFFAIVTGAVRSLREFRLYSALVIVCACIIVLHGHIQHTTGIGWTGQPMIQGRITYSGIFNDPNDIGLLIVLSIAMTLFHLRIQTNRIFRLLSWIALGWLLYGVYLTDSRGTMLATMAVLGLEAWKQYGKAIVITAAMLVVPVLIAFTRLAELNAEEDSAGNRIEAWYEGIQLLVHKPFFGIGWGMFSDYHEMTAHNSFVLAMAELGLAGYTFWLALVLLTGWMIYRLAFPADTVQPLPPQLRQRLAGPTVALAGVGAYPSVAYRMDSVQSRPAQNAAILARNTRGPLAPAIANAPAQVAESTDETSERLAARSLLFAAVGFTIGAFFLSQSYKPMLFINCGLIVGRYLGMRQAGISVPPMSLARSLPLIIVAAFGSVVAMWILVRILL